MRDPYGPAAGRHRGAAIVLALERQLGALAPVKSFYPDVDWLGGRPSRHRDPLPIRRQCRKVEEPSLPTCIDRLRSPGARYPHQLVVPCSRTGRINQSTGSRYGEIRGANPPTPMPTASTVGCPGTFMDFWSKRPTTSALLSWTSRRWPGSE